MKSKKSFFNTTSLQGSELVESESKAKTQEKIVYEFFKSNIGEKFTASNVYKKLGYDKTNTPLTSIRRAMTNLKNFDILLCLKNEKAIGMFGKPECYYMFIY